MSVLSAGIASSRILMAWPNDSNLATGGDLTNLLEKESLLGLFQARLDRSIQSLTAMHLFKGKSVV